MGILPAIHENKLKGEGERKTKKGAAKFKRELKDLRKELALLALPNSTVADNILHPSVKVVDDSNCPSFNDEEGSERIEVSNDNTTNESDDEADNEADDKLIKITLTQAKKYATALHHFVIDNMGHAQLSKLSEASYKLSNVINRMVDSSSKQQRTVYDYFLPNSTSTTATVQEESVNN